MAACSKQDENSDPLPQTYEQKFNMSGYAAPKLDLVRIEVVGLEIEVPVLLEGLLALRVLKSGHYVIWNPIEFKDQQITSVI